MENNDVLKDEKKKPRHGCLKVALSTVVVLLLTMYGCFYTQRNGPHGYGPYTGVVLDAETNEPIEDAQIYLVISTTSFSEVIKGFGKINDYYAHTNSKGKYRIRKHVLIRGYIKNYNMELIIYKAGYIAYSSDSIFKVTSRDDFKTRNNVVLLERWDDGKFSLKDHNEHMQFLDGALRCKRRKARRFCEEAKEEMIIKCMAIGSRFPRSRTQCERIVDEDMY